MPAKDMKGKGEGFPGLEVNKNEGQFITHRAWFSPPPLSPESTTAASMVGGPKLFRGRKSWEIRIKSIPKRFLEYVVGLLSHPRPPPFLGPPFMCLVSTFMSQLRCSLLVKSGQKLCGEPVY